MQDAVTAGREAGVRAIARHRVPAERLARMAGEGAMAYVLRHAHQLAPGHALDIFYAYRAAYLDAARETVPVPSDDPGHRADAPPVPAGVAAQRPSSAAGDPGDGPYEERSDPRDSGDRARRRGPYRRGPLRLP